mmetsp:Transcript_60863/g.72251  ORF Transcript_60863/g.72251 Transcript_60863/m.72251 type:complete len:356 (+) Transcript_60863:297-1364(+)|eukprot:CAMPEP_0172519408 /NCGR_PEP_ID=MMETSP1066-20121228/291399_1 /TAXON_ID=671091 /ORGANISM="Coscinodiscus wailesii, Strain CCMP2513" /LENGTH=355 /DNA_ID=CAMNT_0013301989 /DNA_START=288 /DNA_END=1355 /DNA_ORIENTATION=+
MNWSLSNLKMFIMVPLMLAARKIDGEDANIVFMLRCSYFSIQGIILGIVLYIYIQASILANGPKGKSVFYIPQPPQPLDKNPKKKYTETTQGVHYLTTARNLAASTIFGMALTVGLHFYKGIIMGLAMQTIMGPLTLLENPLAQQYLVGKKGKCFEEKTREELANDDGVEVVNTDGEAVTLKRIVEKEEKNETFGDVLLDTWDIGAEADTSKLMSMLTKENMNYATKESGWTPIMIMSGLGGESSQDAIKKMKEGGADPAIVDGEGWNALHWAAFHGRADAAKVLLAAGGSKEISLCAVKDKEGKTPLDHAEVEGNEDVAKFIKKFMEENKEEEFKVVSENDEGLRRRRKEEGTS